MSHFRNHFSRSVFNAIFRVSLTRESLKFTDVPTWHLGDILLDGRQVTEI